MASGSGIAESLFATLFPSDCRLCFAPLVNISRLPVCQECLGAIQPIEGVTCGVCGELVPTPFALQGSGRPVCGLCRRVTPPFARATAFGSYQGGLRELLHLLKYEQVRPAAGVLGQMLASAIEELEFHDATVLLVPVPLHAGKRRERGFNQSELVVREALKAAASGDRLELRTDLLERTRATKSQIGLTRHQRRENMRGAFRVTKPEEVKGREILLVDDVFTTGTTVSACARVLRQAGASRVWVATVARTLKLNTAEMEFRPEVVAA